MKSRLHRSITAMMAFLILFSSTGFALVEHQCSIRGKSVQLLAAKKAESEKKMGSCCAKRKQQKEAKGSYFKKSACCTEHQKFEKLDVATVSSQLAGKIIKALPAEIVWLTTSYSFIRAEWILPAQPHLPDISFSSRSYGTGMRVLIQSFLI